MAFLSPTATSLRGILVPPALFENAATWGSSSWQVGAILGPAAAGFLYAWIGFANTLLIVTLLVISSFLLYSKIKDRPIAQIAQHDSVVALRKAYGSFSAQRLFSIQFRLIFFPSSLAA